MFTENSNVYHQIMFLSKFGVVIKKLNSTAPHLKQCIRSKSNSKPPKIQQLRPKTPEDEYGDLFQKTMNKPCDNVKPQAKTAKLITPKHKPKSQLFGKNKQIQKDSNRGKTMANKLEEPFLRPPVPSETEGVYKPEEKVTRPEESPCKTAEKSSKREERPTPLVEKVEKAPKPEETPCKTSEQLSKREEKVEKATKPEETPCKSIRREERPTKLVENIPKTEDKCQKTQNTPIKVDEKCPTDRIKKLEEKPCKTEVEQKSPEIKRKSPTSEMATGRDCQSQIPQSTLPKSPKVYPKGKEGRMMDALILLAKNHEVAFGQLPIPNVLKKDEVSIKVKYAVANTTDLMVIEGKIGTCQEEVIPGRELSGTVCGTGDDVQHIKAGDSVVVAPCQPASLCKFCHEQKYEICVKESCGKAFGIDRDGGWAQFAVVPSSLVYKVEGIPLHQAVILPLLAQVMCSLAKMNITPQTEILIQGCGLAGALFALLLQQNGHERVSIWEDNPNRVEVISKMGLGYPVICQGNLEGMHIDLVISNGVGSEAMHQALSALCPHGLFVLFGQPGKNGNTPQLTIATEDISKRSVTMRGMSGTPINPSNISSNLALKILDYSKMGVPTFLLKDFKDGLTLLTTGDINALVFQISKEK